MGLASFNRMRRLAAEKAKRDPLDHDGDGRKGGAPKPDAAKAELAEVRAEYEAKLGKRPYHGWDAKTLREKIAAHDSASKIDLGTDSGDQFSDEQLREMITEASGKAPHHLLGREKLVAQFNALNAEAVAE